ncbi:MAG: PAS domain S-box protein [Pyrinomonadaceae bacterium]
MSIKLGKESDGQKAERDLDKQLREMNEALLVSSVRQHELIENLEISQRALDISEEQFRLTILNAPIPVIMHAEDGRVLQISRSWTELTGYTLEDESVIQSWLLTEAYGYGGECIRDSAHNSFLPPVNDENSHTTICSVKTRDGEVRTWSFNASVPGVLADGRRFVIGMAEDITARILYEQALFENQNRLAESQMRLAMELSATQKLQEVSTELIGEEDSKSLYAKITDAAAAIMRAQSACLQIFDPKRGERGEFRLLSHRGFNAGTARHLDTICPSSANISGAVLDTGQSVSIPNIEASDMLAKSDDLPIFIQNGIHSVHATPLVSRAGQMLGLISTYWHQPHQPVERDLRLLDVLVRQAADLIERSQAEEALRESKERYRALFDLAPMALFACNLDAVIQYYNQRAAELWGREPECGVERHCGSIKLWLPDGRCLPHDQSPMMEVLRTGIPAHNVEVYIERPDGSRLPVLVNFAAVKNAHGEITGTITSFIDITELKKAEGFLQRYRLLSENATDIIWLLRPDGKIVEVNQAAVESYGYSREELLTMNVRELLEPSTLPLLAEHLKQANDGGSNFETLHRRKDGTVFPVEVNTSSADFGGEHLIMGIVRDITERKRIETDLRESEERLRLILESVTDYAIFTTDINGKVTGWNPGAQIVFGYEPDEIIGLSADVLFTPEDRKNLVPQKEMATALANGRAEDERWHMRKDESRFFASGVMTLLEDGGPLGFVKVARDQTVRMQAESALHKQEMLKKLVKSQEDERQRIARDLHDHLGQQMTGLRLKLKALKDACGDNEPFCEQIGQVQEQARQIDGDVGFLAFELRPTALDDLGLDSALANFVKQWSRNYNIPAEFHSSRIGKKRLLPEIETNLYRIAQEALHNTLKHAKASGVNVLFERRKEHFVLILEDNGIGFNPEVQINKVTKSGKGLGLIGMRERSSLVGGSLEIESSRGKGTTIFARVPARFVGE